MMFRRSIIVEGKVVNQVGSSRQLDEDCFRKKHKELQEYWEINCNVPGGTHTTDRTAMYKVINAMLQSPSAPEKAQICWDIGVGLPVFAHLISYFLGMPVIGLDVGK